MNKEIERKFLVSGDFKSFALSKTRIIQGYLSRVPERTVRVRIKDDKGIITIKGAGSSSGMTRLEWEMELPLDEAKELLEICEPGLIDKIRFIIPETSGLRFEVDVFSGENQGLVIAEIELPDEKYPFEKPAWLGSEVTGDHRYYNASLSEKPFTLW